MAWGAFIMAKIWRYFRAFVAAVCFFGAFVVWHGESIGWFVLGGLLMGAAVWAGVSLSKEDEDRDNPII